MEGSAMATIVTSRTTTNCATQSNPIPALLTVL